MNLTELVTYLDTELRIAEIPDYPNAYNGLQCENAANKVTKIVAAVDATLPVMPNAVALVAGLSVVHCGVSGIVALPLTVSSSRQM